jgi:hypothetical protein
MKKGAGALASRRSMRASASAVLAYAAMLRALRSSAGHRATRQVGGRGSRLVADGLKQQADRRASVHIRATVDGHVQNILNKTGFNSRAQAYAANWRQELARLPPAD